MVPDKSEAFYKYAVNMSSTDRNKVEDIILRGYNTHHHHINCYFAEYT